MAACFACQLLLHKKSGIAASILYFPHHLQVLQANLDIPRCMLGEEAANYKLSAALLQRFARKHELR